MLIRVIILTVTCILAVDSGREQRFLIPDYIPTTCCVCSNDNSSQPDCSAICTKNQHENCGRPHNFCMTRLAVKHGAWVLKSRSCATKEMCAAAYHEALKTPGCNMASTSHVNLQECTFCCRALSIHDANICIKNDRTFVNFSDSQGSLFTIPAMPFTTFAPTPLQTLSTKTSMSTTQSPPTTTKSSPTSTTQTSPTTAQTPPTTSQTPSTTTQKLPTTTQTSPMTTKSSPTTSKSSFAPTKPTSLTTTVCQVCTGSTCHDDPVVCPSNQPFCMNAVEKHGNSVTALKKGCASYTECFFETFIQQQNRHECVPSYTTQTRSGPIFCRYCCISGSSTPCNTGAIPNVTLNFAHTASTTTVLSSVPTNMTITSIPSTSTAAPSTSDKISTKAPFSSSTSKPTISTSKSTPSTSSSSTTNELTSKTTSPMLTTVPSPTDTPVQVSTKGSSSMSTNYLTSKSTLATLTSVLSPTDTPVQVSTKASSAMSTNDFTSKSTLSTLTAVPSSTDTPVQVSTKASSAMSTNDFTLKSTLSTLTAVPSSTDSSGNVSTKGSTQSMLTNVPSISSTPVQVSTNAPSFTAQSNAPVSSEPVTRTPDLSTNSHLQPNTTSVSLTQITTSAVNNLHTEATDCTVCAGPVKFCESYYKTQTCASPNNYCLNSVINFVNGSRKVERKCANYETCYREWFLGTSDVDRCLQFDPRYVKTLNFQCSYCCIKDNCNENLVPPSETLYKPRI